MYGRTEAEADGWTFDVDGENGVAARDGERKFDVTSLTPLFSMLVTVAAGGGALRAAAMSASGTGSRITGSNAPRNLSVSARQFATRRARSARPRPR